MNSSLTVLDDTDHESATEIYIEPNIQESVKERQKISSCRLRVIQHANLLSNRYMRR